MAGIYDFTVKDIQGNEYNLSGLAGKVILIVNVASKCGFTYQYEGLQKLYEKYSEKGLAVLGFPSNDFLQEPGSPEEILDFCTLNYGVSFPMFSKVKLRGSKADPLYKFLTSGAGDKKYKGSIKWNFTKFLFNSEGRIEGRFAPSVKPEAIEDKIKALIEK